MKRFISILLAISILFGNTGWALTAHYCMGEKVGIYLRYAGLPNKESHECSKCGMEKASTDNGCCHDEEVAIKGAQDAISGSSSIELILSVVGLPVPHFISNIHDLLVYTSKHVGSFNPHGPPGYTGPPLYIYNCVFLI